MNGSGLRGGEDRMTRLLPPSPAAAMRFGINLASAALTVSRILKPVTPRIDDAAGITTCATVPGFVTTVIGLKAPAVNGTSVLSAAMIGWYTLACANGRGVFSDPGTIGADSDKSTITWLPSIVSVT